MIVTKKLGQNVSNHWASSLYIYLNDDQRDMIDENLLMSCWFVNYNLLSAK